MGLLVLLKLKFAVAFQKKEIHKNEQYRIGICD